MDYNNSMKNYIRKVTELFEDKRSYFNRFLLSLLPCGTLVFIVFFFGPLDIYTANISHFGVKLEYVAVPLASVFLVCLLLLAAFVAIIRGKLFDLIILLITVLSVCFYIQGTFLNGTLGKLNGQQVQWHLKTTDASINLLLWFIVVLIQLFVFYIFSDKNYNIIVFFCTLLIVMQSAALVSEIISSEKQKGYYLSGENQYNLAEDNNVVIFVLDSMTDDILMDALKYDRKIEASFSDFILFDNCNAEYTFTSPGLIHLITSSEYNPSISYDSNVFEMWNSKKDVFREIKEAEYCVEIYSDSPSCIYADNAEIAMDVIDNIDIQREDFVEKEAIIELIKISLYRYMPTIAKACFWSYPTGESFVNAGSVRSLCNYRFVEQLREKGLKKQQDCKGAVKVYHLEGAHEPYSVSAEGKYSMSATSEIQATAGYLRGISEYLNDMKSIGVYDNALIIITADHGKLGRPQCGMLVKDKNSIHDELIKSSAPVCQTDVLPTVLDYIGVDSNCFSRTVFDIKEDEKRERTYHCFCYINDFPGLEGDNNAVKEFDYVGDSETIKEKYAKDEYDRVSVLVK